MCSLTAGLMAASALVGVKAQQEQADAQASAARAQADNARQNAAIENKRQETIADRYAQEDVKRRAQARLVAGHNTANAGAANLSTQPGTSVWDILSSSEEQFQNDRNISLTNQRTDNYNSRLTQVNYENQARSYDAQANNIENNAKWGNFNTILGSVAAISGNVGGGSAASSTASDIPSATFSNRSANILYSLNGKKTKNWA